VYLSNGQGRSDDEGVVVHVAGKVREVEVVELVG